MRVCFVRGSGTRYLAGVALIARLASAQEPVPTPAPTPPTGYDDTPFLPGGEWRVHDGRRPRPQVVTPGAPQAPVPAPSDALVLFDGTDLSKWRKADGTPAAWKIENGYFEIAPKAGDMFTRDTFGDCQLHVEWATPTPPKGASQGRGNSGIFLMGRYEVQVLDSYDNLTYADGQAAAIYGQYPPLVNAARKPGEWQTYDIAFTAPVFKDGQLVSTAYVTVFHNGVLVQNHRALLGETMHRQLGTYTPHEAKASLRLQDHNNPVRFRNIWVRSIS